MSETYAWNRFLGGREGFLAFGSPSYSKYQGSQYHNILIDYRVYPKFPLRLVTSTSSQVPSLAEIPQE